jgi:hypothetical protein
MPRFTTHSDIIKHVRGKLPHMVFLGPDYTIADLIVDLEYIDEQGVADVLPLDSMTEAFVGRKTEAKE